MTFKAPAKINLYLDILGKRDDGYHEIHTLFEKVSLFDRLTFEVHDKPFEILSNKSGIPLGEGSLLHRTAELFSKKIQKEIKVKVFLEKNIPIAGGLGGGSSDAAALLKGLNEFTESSLTVDELAQMARELGADIPFFVYDAPFGIGKGRGDVITPLFEETNIDHIIVNPPLEVSTELIYSKVDQIALTKDNGIDRMFTSFLRENDIGSVAKNLRNGLQQITLQSFPQLNDIFVYLKEKGAKGVLLSGSGPSVFGIFDKEYIETAVKELKKQFSQEKGWTVFSASTFAE